MEGKRRCALFAAFVLIGMSVYGANEYVLKKTEGSSSLASYGFFDPTLWNPSSDAFDAAGVYKVIGNVSNGGSAHRLTILRTDSSKSYEFAGGRIQLGEGTTKQGWVEIMAGWPDAMKFGGEGLEIRWGGIFCRNSRCLTDGVITLKSSNNVRRMAIVSEYDNAIYRHKGSIVTDTTRALYLGGTNGFMTTWRKGLRFEFTGDCSRCTSPITLWTHNEEVTTSPEVTFVVGGTELPGEVNVSANGALGTFNGSNPVIRSVAFKGNNWLECTRAPDGITVGAVGLMTVTGALSVARGPVKIVAPKHPPANGTYPVLVFPADSAATIDDFTLADGVGSGHCSLSFETSGDKKILSLVYEGLPAYTPLVHQTVSSATVGISEEWSDGTDTAQPGKRYLLDVDVLTAEDPSVRLVVPKTVAACNFSGDSLTIGEDCTLRFETENPNDDVHFNCAELNLAHGSSVEGTKTYYSLVGGTVNLGGTVTIAASSGRDVRIRSELKGMGVLKFCSIASGSVPYGNLHLIADNSNYLGTIDTTLRRPSYASFDEKYQKIYVLKDTSVGGNLETLNRAALVLNHYARFCPGSATPVTIHEASNRGILVRNGAVFEVPKGRSLTVCTPLSLDGELRKAGTGPLTLKGSAAGFGSAGSADTPVAGKNIFAVQAGALKIGSADAVNGMALSFASGASLVLLPNFDDKDLMRYGIRNVKTDTPYTLGAGVADLPFSVGEASGTPPQGVAFRLGLLTVPDVQSARQLARDAAQSVKYRVRGYRSTLVEDDTSEPGAVTFALDFTPIGFSLIVR